MDKRRIRGILFGAAILLAVTAPCHAVATLAAIAPMWGRYQDEEAFLQWYEEHRDSGGEFSLNGMLNLKSGTDRDPIILDGEGKIKINCGSSGFSVGCPLIIDNPNLEIVSEEFYGITVNHGSLYLVNGTLTVSGSIGIYLMEGELHTADALEDIEEDGMDLTALKASASEASKADPSEKLKASASEASKADPSEEPKASASEASKAGTLERLKASPSDADCRMMSGKAVPFQSDGMFNGKYEIPMDSAFKIQVTVNDSYGVDGESVYGIFLASAVYNPGVTDLELSNLEISVSGVQSYGIMNGAGAVALWDSTVQSNGSRETYGVWALDEIEITDCDVTAEGPSGAALYNEGKTIAVKGDSSVFGPDGSQNRVFVVEAQAGTLNPVAVRTGTAASEIPFPDSVEMVLKKPGTAERESHLVRIKGWDSSEVNLSEVGSYTAEGYLDEEALTDLKAVNTGEIKVSQRVAVLDESGTYIDSITFDKNRDVCETYSWIHMWCIKPVGAEALYVEYNRDGENWIAAEYAPGKKNWLHNPDSNSQFLTGGKYNMDVKIPYVNGTVGVRLHTVGGGVYEGTGYASTVNIKEGTVQDVWNKDFVDDGSGGDRGGGDITQKPEHGEDENSGSSLPPGGSSVGGEEDDAQGGGENGIEEGGVNKDHENGNISGAAGENGTGSGSNGGKGRGSGNGSSRVETIVDVAPVSETPVDVAPVSETPVSEAPVSGASVSGAPGTDKSGNTEKEPMEGDMKAVDRLMEQTYDTADIPVLNGETEADPAHPETSEEEEMVSSDEARHSLSGNLVPRIIAAAVILASAGWFSVWCVKKWTGKMR